MTKINSAPTRFRTINVSQVKSVPELIEKYVYIINYGRGVETKKPIAVSIPFRLYDEIKEIAELLTVLVNYGEAMYLLENRKFNGPEQKARIQEIIEGCKENINALRQVILEEGMKAISNLEN